LEIHLGTIATYKVSELTCCGLTCCVGAFAVASQRPYHFNAVLNGIHLFTICTPYPHENFDWGTAKWALRASTVMCNLVGAFLANAAVAARQNHYIAWLVLAHEALRVDVATILKRVADNCGLVHECLCFFTMFRKLYSLSLLEEILALSL